MQKLDTLPTPDDPEKALAAVVSLRLIAAKLERRAVIEAITQGWTWAQVAEALGVSRQAVHKRYARIVKTSGNKNADFTV